jgi:glycosyltransferase involved in cell wall biosynthesis
MVFTFSVIVLVYNDEKNLPRCLDSIISQKFIDFECLLIDDGSTDRCPEICDNYVKRDNRIKVIHKPNEGISKTRQLGLNEAKGNYIFFVDSDDWVSPTLLSDAHQKIASDQCDILLTDFYETNHSGKEQYRQQAPVSLDTENIIKSILSVKLSSCVWNVFIRINFCKENNISFSVNVNYGEDSIFILEILLRNPKIAYLPSANYHHVYNSNSYTRKDTIAKYNERKLFFHKLDNILIEHRREDLQKINFFPLSAKYEMLSDGMLSKSEYQSIFAIQIGINYLKETGLRKYCLLSIAESNLYFIAKFFAIIIRKIKNTIN